MKTLSIDCGQKVSHANKNYVIKSILDLKAVILEDPNTGELLRANISELDAEVVEVEPISMDREFISIPDKHLQVAQHRFSIIRELLEGTNTKSVDEIAKEAGVFRSTIYRWIDRYEQTGLVSSLAPSEGKGAKGKSRLDPEVDLIIKGAIDEFYLTNQKKPVQKVCIEVQKQCVNAGLKPPHVLTVRNRINQLSEYERLKKRNGAKAAKEMFEPKVGTFPGAETPLSVVQIDHTLLDIILVDETYRKPVGRPWITVAIDIYSRMVVGFYISFETPGAMGTGLCIAHAILDKEEYLARLDVQGDWPCWGKMRTIHVDNAKEFRGNMLRKACLEYGIELTWRPVATPNWGGNVERFIKTLVKEVHTLPGTTFSKPSDRKDYDSVKKASLTLRELEKWVAEFIVNVYHQRPHTALQMSPIDKYKQGLFGTEGKLGTGIPPKILDKRKVRLDFMPYEERTIQHYGVIIDNISYYGDVMRKWINSTDEKSGKARLKKKFIFKRDPRDISKVYFFDPELRDYHQIPYRDTSRPAMSIWEYREIIKRLKDDGMRRIDENAIFQTYDRMMELEKSAVSKTLKSKRLGGKKLLRASKQEKPSVHEEIEPIGNTEETVSQVINISRNIKPFEDYEHGASR